MDSVKELEAHIEALKEAFQRALFNSEKTILSREIRDAIELHWQMTKPTSRSPWQIPYTTWNTGTPSIQTGMTTSYGGANDDTNG